MSTDDLTFTNVTWAEQFRDAEWVEYYLETLTLPEPEWRTPEHIATFIREYLTMKKVVLAHYHVGFTISEVGITYLTLSGCLAVQCITREIDAEYTTNGGEVWTHYNINGEDEADFATYVVTAIATAFIRRYRYAPIIVTE